MDGRIERVIEDKGFGFLKDSLGTERFFHASQVQNLPGKFTKAALVNRAVTFDPDKGPKGDRAVNVRLTD